MNKYFNCVNHARRAVSIINSSVLLRYVGFILAPDWKEPLRHPPIIFFRAPVLADKLFHPIPNRRASDYRSQYGVTQG